MIESALFLVLANHIRDIYNQLSSTIIEAKSHRPTWHVTTIRVPERDPLTGMTYEREEKIVDRLSPLMGIAKILEDSASVVSPNTADGIDNTNQLV